MEIVHLLNVILYFMFFSFLLNCLNLDKPEILENNPTTLVNETEQVTLIRQIVSNPLSNASWYNGSELLVTQPLVMNATFYIKEATCTDTKNFTLVASNIVQENVTALVELIVNCECIICFLHAKSTFLINDCFLYADVVNRFDILNTSYIHILYTNFYSQ